MHAGMAAGAVFLMVAVVATAAALERFSTFYQGELSRVDNRELPLDGLRGIAALLVVAHHAGISYTWLVSGQWKTDSAFIMWLGPGGVTMFFMLTGYLFWKKARAAKGKVNAMNLWRGRLYRIGPLYWFSLCPILIIAVIKTDAGVLVPANWQEFLRLVTLGAIHWKPTGDTDFATYNAYVVWTLYFEWRFYAFLPLLSFMSTGRKTYWLAILAYFVPVAGFWLNFNPWPWLMCILSFIPGMICAVVLDDDRLRSRLRQPASAAIALFAMAFFFSIQYDPWSVPALPGALLPVFVVAAAGNNFFGLLTHPAIRCLGTISYSLYLLHGIIFYLTSSALKQMGLTGLSLLNYWVVITISAVAAVLVCAATYRWIEFPFLARRHATTVNKA